MNSGDLFELRQLLADTPLNIHVHLHSSESEVLTEIGHQLKRIEQTLQTIMKTQAEFDAEQADFLADIKKTLRDSVAAIDAAVQTIIDAINNGSKPADLQTEFDALEAARSDFKTTLGSIPGQLPSTPTPAAEPPPAP